MSKENLIIELQRRKAELRKELYGINTLLGITIGFNHPKKEVDKEAIVHIAEREVCSFYNIPVYDLKVKTREREVADARAIVMYVIREHTKYTLTDIGSIYNLHHATVLHSCKKARKMLQDSQGLMDLMRKIDVMVDKKIDDSVII